MNNENNDKGCNNFTYCFSTKKPEQPNDLSDTDFLTIDDMNTSISDINDLMKFE